jgi:hypothetical protein
MPDDRISMTHAQPVPNDAALAAALQALPLATPARSAWMDLQQELAASAVPNPKRRTLPKWIALAATLVAAVVGVRFHGTTTPDDASTQPQGAAPSAETLALIERSKQLDAVLATLDARSVPIDASNAMASAELENLIGLTDLQLNAVRHDAEAQALWSRRVDLMTRLAGTRTNARFGSDSDDGGAYLQDANYRID